MVTVKNFKNLSWTITNLIHDCYGYVDDGSISTSDHEQWNTHLRRDAHRWIFPKEFFICRAEKYRWKWAWVLMPHFDAIWCLSAKQMYNFITVNVWSWISNRGLLQHGPIWHDIAYIAAMMEAEYKSVFELTKYLAWRASCELFFVRICEKIDRVIMVLQCILH